MIMDQTFDTIKCLTSVQLRMNSMSEKDAQDFRLDDCLGGSSAVLNQISINRIYGKITGKTVIEWLKEHPLVSVPVVLKRLEEKRDEWSREKRKFQMLWSERQRRGLKPRGNKKRANSTPSTPKTKKSRKKQPEPDRFDMVPSMIYPSKIND